VRLRIIYITGSIDVGLPFALAEKTSKRHPCGQCTRKMRIKLATREDEHGGQARSMGGATNAETKCETFVAVTVEGTERDSFLNANE
jgi:hypothetical protein